MSPDFPLIDQYVEDPQSWNLYSYVRNNPLNAIDPTGQDCIYINDNSVDLERGKCSKKSGIYVDGTIDSKSFTYDPKKGTLGYSYTNNGALGVGVINGVWPAASRSLSQAEIFITEMSLRRDASNQAIASFAAAQAVFATSFAATYAGPALYTTLVAGGEAGVLRWGGTVFEVVRDKSGKVHFPKVLPRSIPTWVSRAQLEVAAQELRGSIAVRTAEMIARGDKGKHGLRIMEEQRLLYRIERALRQR